MLPSNVDPRRPEKVNRLKSKPEKPTTTNNKEDVNSKPTETNNITNGSQVEDLTPDYMNILGQHATTATTAAAPDAVDGRADMQPIAEDAAEATAAATNVIPTSPQYGVAIISNALNPAEVIGGAADHSLPTAGTDGAPTKPPDDIKDLHSTPSRNDRFKVVKIASLEPFKRGRWKCMDYVDEAPPSTSQQGGSKVTQSTGSIQVAGGVYFQTQSLPQQQIQQMLLQGGFTNGTTQFVPTQVLPQGQYFYPQVTTIQTQTLPQQLVNSTGVPSTMPAQFISTSQSYFPAGVVPNAAGFTIPQTYPNIQYVPANLLQNQNSAFVPTSQLPANFQQSQTYSGQPNVTQPAVSQPVVNGHAFPDQVTPSSLPTQAAKTVILNGAQQQQQQPSSQTQINQPNVQNQMGQSNNNAQSQSVPVIQQQQFPQQNFQPLPGQQHQKQQNSSQVNTVNTVPIIQTPGLIQMPQMMSVPSQSFDHSLASNVYTNPQFAMSVNSLSVLENNDNNSTDNVGESGTTASESTGESSDDPAKTNPVVNAIDNKIEQAMDLVKSHLMYTVREEVEVLKEKIAELMERIQQLETENNYLRSQIPKSQQGGANSGTVQPSANSASASNALPPSVAASPASISAASVNPAAPPLGNVVTGTGDIASQQ